MAFLYPWGNTQQLNLDWIIQKIKELESAPPGAAEITGIANALLALTYNGGTAYDEGDIVYRNEKLYVCNTTIASPGETWNPAHWDEVLLGDAVADLIQKTAGGIVQDVRYNNHKIQQKKAGSYADVIPVEDTPSNNSDRLASSKAAYDLKDAINAILDQTDIGNTGGYVKLYGGVLIQWNNVDGITVDLTTQDPDSGLYKQSDSVQMDLRTPFYNASYFVIAVFQYDRGAPMSLPIRPNAKATNLFYADPISYTSVSGNLGKISWFAIGRWK